METYLQIENDQIFLSHNLIIPNRPSLLFVHGLGESGQCFQEVFDDQRFDDFNLLVPDLIGYGRSSASKSRDYSFKTQVNMLRGIIDQLKLKRVILIGHSMGGDLTTLLCTLDRNKIIAKYVNIEGDVTQDDISISKLAVEAAERGEFDKWFKTDFLQETVFNDWGRKYESCRRYYASLCFCRPEAFLANAHECYARNNSLEGKFKSEIGKKYSSLAIPRTFCYGSRSIADTTIQFLQEMELECCAFEGASHWVMIDKPNEFYSFLYDYVCEFEDATSMVQIFPIE